MNVYNTVVQLFQRSLKDVSNVVYAGACAGGVHVLHSPGGLIASKGSLYKDDERCQWRIELHTSKVRRCSICLQCKTLNKQRQIRAFNKTVSLVALFMHTIYQGLVKLLIGQQAGPDAH